MQLVIGIMGLIATTIAIVVSIIVARRYRDRRELSYEISTTPKLLSVDEMIRKRVEIRYEGREVRNLSGITVTVRNTGNRAVEVPQKTQTETPITLDFGRDSEIIGEPRVTKIDPGDLDATVMATDSKVVLEPVLLNKGQSISIFEILTNSQAGVKVAAHIKDVAIKEIKAEKRRLPESLSISIGALLGVLVSMIVALVPALIDLANNSSLAGSIDEVYFLVFGVLVVLTLLIAFRRSLSQYLKR